MSGKPSALFVTALIVAGAASACGNNVGDVEQVGRVGVTVDEAGSPVVVVEPCREGTAYVSIDLARSPGMSPTEKNAVVSHWTATAPSAQRSLLALSDPGPGWTGEAGPLPTGATWIASAGFDDATKNQTMGQVVVSTREMAGLTPDQVLVSDDGGDTTTMPLDSFDGACD